jgi:ABC-type uncharacterized transport system substrate-binding protein
MVGIERREFIALLSGAAAWPLAARAQQPATPVIGFLNSETPEVSAIRLRGFRQGLSEAGYVEGQNLAIEYRWGDGHYDRLPALATDLVRRRVDLITATGAVASVLGAKAATTTIPIVFFTGSDPVAIGLVASRDLPGGNLTGVINLNREVEPKRLELVHELLPGTAVIAYLVTPTDPDAVTNTKNLEAAAAPLGLRLDVLHAAAERDLDIVFATLAQLRVGGLVIASHPFFFSRIDQIAALTVRHAIPATTQYREFAAAGGLMSYGVSVAESYRLVGAYSAQILKGDKPGELPVQQARPELVFNLKTAKALGLSIPPTLLALADEVIE